MSANENQTLFRLRVRYVKRGRLAYLGHLEVIHTVERSVRRAGFPYAVTQGFSPHMRIGYTSALPVGTSSDCEYFDVFLTELVGADDALRRLRASSPADLAPQEAAYVAVRDPALTAQVNRIDYSAELTFRPGIRVAAEEASRAFDRLIETGEVPYLRGKKSKILDLSRTLKGVKVNQLPEGLEVHLVTACDNDGSLRPEILFAAFDRVLSGSGLADEPIVSTGIQELRRFSRCRVARCGQYVEQDGVTTDPFGRTLPEN